MDTNLTKRCAICDEVKDLSEFYGGTYSYCRSCDLIHQRNRYRSYGKSETRREKERQGNWRRKFNLTAEEYDALFLIQDGKCASCGNEEMLIDPRSKERRKLAVDHCHITGRVRALLCTACNTALGLLNEDPTRIQALLHYAQALKKIMANSNENDISYVK